MSPHATHPFVDFLVQRGVLATTEDVSYAADTTADVIAADLGRREGVDVPALDRARLEFNAQTSTQGLPEQESTDAGDVPAKPAGGLVGRVLGSYRLEELVGRGGQASVYRATHADLDREVAVKVLHGYLTSEDSIERLRREALAMIGLKHDNIVDFYDFGCTDGLHWLAMEFVPGESAGARVRRDGKMPARDVERIVAEVLCGLGRAHGLGGEVVHRDLSANNVLLREPDDTALIADFGLASGPSLGHTVTKSGVVVGTLAYIAPEVYDEQPATHRSDLWAIGVLACELATGSVPFRGSTAASVMHSVCNDAPDLTKLPSGPLRHLAAACLIKDPAQRIETADRALEILRTPSAASPRSGVGWLVAVVLVAAAAVVWFREDLFGKGATPVTPPEVAKGGGNGASPAKQPDGKGEAGLEPAETVGDAGKKPPAKVVPGAEDVHINHDGSLNLGATLHARYRYVDAQGRAEATRFRWFRNGDPIGDATERSYVLVVDDLEARIAVEVTPAVVDGPEGKAETSKAIAIPMPPLVGDVRTIVSAEPLDLARLSESLAKLNGAEPPALVGLAEAQLTRIEAGALEAALKAPVGSTDRTWQGHLQEIHERVKDPALRLLLSKALAWCRVWHDGEQLVAGSTVPSVSQVRDYSSRLGAAEQPEHVASDVTRLQEKIGALNEAAKLIQQWQGPEGTGPHELPSKAEWEAWQKEGASSCRALEKFNADCAKHMESELGKLRRAVEGLFVAKMTEDVCRDVRTVDAVTETVASWRRRAADLGVGAQADVKPLWDRFEEEKRAASLMAEAQRGPLLSAGVDLANVPQPYRNAIRDKLVQAPRGFVGVGVERVNMNADGSGSLAPKQLRHLATGIVLVWIPKRGFHGGWYMAETETTNGQWDRGGGTEGTEPEDRPKVNVSYAAAQAFARGLSFRIPRQDEWQYASAAGKSVAFPCDPESLAQHAWFRDNANGQLQPVRQLRCNAWGLYDMHGSVWEWTSSSKWVSRAEKGCPIVCGGCFNSTRPMCSNERPVTLLPDPRPDCGFRVVLDSPW